MAELLIQTIMKEFQKLLDFLEFSFIWQSLHNLLFPRLHLFILLCSEQLLIANKSKTWNYHVEVGCFIACLLPAVFILRSHNLKQNFAYFSDELQ